jgi:hypothetical protein
MRNLKHYLPLVSTVIVVAAIWVLWFPPAKSIVVPMGYPAATNKLASWLPAKTTRGYSSDVRAEEKVPGALFLRVIFERGDPKAGPFTKVRVGRLDSSNSTVELSTTTMNYVLPGSVHPFLLERQRWNEMRELFGR